MNVLLVNNDSDTWDELQAVAKAAGYNVTPIHCSAIGAIDPRGYNLAILSGGWWYDDEVELLETYAEELMFIRTTPIPILGICIGMQLMHVSVDQAVPLMAERENGWKEIDVNVSGQMIFDFPEKIKVFKNHDRAVFETDPQFDEVASSSGHAEILLHRTRPLLGVQFHPEVGETKEAAAMLKTLVDALLKRSRQFSGTLDS
jgi:GMP synthase-like glutamine amidotransferase